MSPAAGPAVGPAGLSPGEPRGTITVTGGSGGIVVALQDLEGVASALRAGTEVVGAGAGALRRLDLWSLGALVAGPDAAAALARAEWQRARLVVQVRDLSQALDDLTRRTRRVIAAYRLAEQEAELTIRLARESVVVVTRSLQALGDPVGLLRDGRTASVEATGVDGESRVVIHDLGSVMGSQSQLSGRPVVRVVEIPQHGGSSAWILQIPGTLVWDPRAGAVAHDVTSDLRLMGQQQGVLTEAALEALAWAQADSGRLGRQDPVMVTGYSLGGIAAMAIASDPRAHERFSISHVVTAGAPVALFAVPDGVTALSLEHVDDVVPWADLAANPDRPNWTTVRRDVSGSRMPPTGPGPSPHAVVTYGETARLAAIAAKDGAEPSLVAWSATTGPFFAGTPALHPANHPEQRVRDYLVSRVTESPS